MKPTERPPDRLLLGPGPSPVSDRVRQAMARPLVGHLDPWFSNLLDEVSAMLREVFLTENELTFAVSGTGSAAMETAVLNTVGPGDEFIVGIAGAFGERIAEMGVRAGATVIRVETDWGTIVEPTQVAEALDAHPSAAAVALVHAETSTGLSQPLQEVGRLLDQSDTLFLVDAVTSLGGSELKVDEWQIDICYSATQKCLSVPPGLAPITFSEKAIQRRASRQSRPSTWYFDVTLIGSYWGKERIYHHTAPISMMYGLAEGLRQVVEEGLEQRWNRHAKVGADLVVQLTSRGYVVLAAEPNRLGQITAVLVDEGSELGLRKRLLETHGIEVGGGMGRFAGSMIRVGLMGEGARPQNVARLVAALDESI